MHHRAAPGKMGSHGANVQNQGMRCKPEWYGSRVSGPKILGGLLPESNLLLVQDAFGIQI